MTVRRILGEHNDSNAFGDFRIYTRLYIGLLFTGKVL